MDKQTALDILGRCGATARPDFHTLPASSVCELLEFADEYKYRKPKNANGSRGRYFYARVLRAAAVQ